MASPYKLPLALLVAYLAFMALLVVPYGLSRAITSDEEDHLSDLNVFYPAGALIFTEDRTLVYDPDAANDLEQPENRGAVGNFFNPPLFAVLFSPLAEFEFGTAEVVFGVVCFLATAGIAALAFFWSRSWPVAGLALLACATYLPVYEAARSGQPSSVFALALGLSLAGAVSGRWWSSVLLGFMALKPSLAIAPLGFTAYIGDRRLVAVAAVAIVLLVLVPFALVGFGGFVDYIELVGRARNDAFTLKGGITAGAAYMMNWNAFWGRLLVADPSPFLVFPFYLATALLMVRVWTRRDIPRSYLAGAIATLLVTPHLLWYDWVIFLPAAFAAAIARPSVPLVACLMLVHLTASLNTYQITHDNIFQSDARIVMFSTLAAILTLAYLAFEPELEAWLARWDKHRSLDTEPSLNMPA